MDFGSIMGAILRAPIPTAEPERDRALLFVLAGLAERPGAPVVCSATALATRARIANLRTLYGALRRLAGAGLVRAEGRGVALDLAAIDGLGRDASWRGRLPDGDLAGCLNKSGHGDHPTGHGNQSDEAPIALARVVTVTSPTGHGNQSPLVTVTSPTGHGNQCSIYDPNCPSTRPLSDPYPEPSAQGTGLGEIERPEQQGAPGGLEKIARGVATSPHTHTRAGLEATIMADLFPNSPGRPLLPPLSAALTGAMGVWVGIGGEEEALRVASEEWAACVGTPHPLATLRTRMVLRARAAQEGAG